MAFAPDTPGQPEVSDVQPTQCTLRWKTPHHGGSPLLGYQLCVPKRCVIAHSPLSHFLASLPVRFYPSPLPLTRPYGLFCASASLGSLSQRKEHVDRPNSWKLTYEAPAPAIGAVVRGLVSERSYRFKLVCVNGTGDSQPSQPTDWVTTPSRLQYILAQTKALIAQQKLEAEREQQQKGEDDGSPSVDSASEKTEPTNIVGKDSSNSNS